MKRKLKQITLMILAMLWLLLIPVLPTQASTNKVFVGNEITLSFPSSSEKEVTWLVKDPNVLMLKSTGQSSSSISTPWGGSSEIEYKATFVGLSIGTTSISAKDESGNLLFSAEVSVEKSDFDFHLNFDCIFLSSGESFQLKPIKVPNGQTLVWTSDNPFATVSSNGIVSLNWTNRVSKITCRTSDGLYSATCTVIGDSPTYYPDLTLMIGESGQLAYSVAVYDRLPQLNGTYSSSNPSIVSVDEKGMVYAKAPGMATIFAQVGNKLFYYYVSSVFPEPTATPIPTNTPTPTPTATPTPTPAISQLNATIKKSEWLSTNKMQITGTANKDGEAYIKVVKKGDTAPSASEIIATSEKTNVSANEDFTLNYLTYSGEFGTSAITAYICVKESATGNTIVKSIDMNMLTRPAKLTGSSAIWTGYHSAEIVLRSDKYGVCYWGWTERGNGMLSIAECKKGSSVTANTNFKIVADGLFSSNPIDVYFYVKGNDGTISTPLVARLSQNSRPAHAKTGKITVTKATTTKNGSTVTKCSECGKEINKQTIYYPKTIKLSATSYTYNGKAQRPKVSVTGADGKEISSSNYALAYSAGCKNAGTYKVKITFKGNYSGGITKSFTIKKASQTISATNKIKILGAKVFSLNAKRTKGNGKLTYKSSNAKVATVSNAGKITIKGIGKATITITAAATTNYNKATKKVVITVNPKGTSLTGSVKNSGSKKMTVQWKRSKSVTGYQIRYATDSSFKGAKTVTVKKNSTLKTTITKLTKGKTYYVQIRTYKTVSGKNYYSEWSNAKKVKIAK